MTPPPKEQGENQELRPALSHRDALLRVMELNMKNAEYRETIRKLVFDAKETFDVLDGYQPTDRLQLFRIKSNLESSVALAEKQLDEK